MIRDGFIDAIERSPYPENVFSWENPKTNLIVFGYFTALSVLAERLGYPDIVKMADDKVKYINSLREKPKR
jgi:hypothetical protein